MQNRGIEQKKRSKFEELRGRMSKQGTDKQSLKSGREWGE